jgi:hypothetical protein
MATRGGGPFSDRNLFPGACFWRLVWRFSSFEPNLFQRGAVDGVVPLRALEVNATLTCLLSSKTLRSNGLAH